MSSSIKAVGELTDSLKKKGVDAFKESFPKKIEFINSLLSNGACLCLCAWTECRYAVLSAFEAPGGDPPPHTILTVGRRHCPFHPPPHTELLNKDTDSILPPLEDLTPAVPPPLAAAAPAPTTGGARGSKKRKKTETGAAAPAAPPPTSTAHAHSDSEEDSEDELGGYHARGGHYDHAHDFKVPCNTHIIRVMELLRKEWKEAVEIVGAVKLWIQLSIPPIESGGAFAFWKGGCGMAFVGGFGSRLVCL